jgi:ABC-type polysaccharide/polyol phosphate export permease
MPAHPLSTPGRSFSARAIADLRAGLLSLHLWPMLAWLEIKHRYRRSLLGPLWLTISTALFIAGMGSLYGVLLGQSKSQYIHYLSVGLVVWLFIAGLIADGCQTFIAAEGFVKQTRLPLTVHALRVVCRNVLVLMHNFIIVVIVSAYFRPDWGWGLLTAPAGVFVIALNGLAWALLLGLTSARFRDIPQIVASLVQLLFFVTPIFWRPDMLADHRWVAQWNPVFHLIEIVRAPILGDAVPVESWCIALGVTVLGWLFAFAAFARYRARIAYWT